MLWTLCHGAEDILLEIFLTPSVLFNYEKASPLHIYNYLKLFILQRGIDLCRSFSPACGVHMDLGIRPQDGASPLRTVVTSRL